MDKAWAIAGVAVAAYLLSDPIPKATQKTYDDEEAADAYWQSSKFLTATRYDLVEGKKTAADVDKLNPGLAEKILYNKPLPPVIKPTLTPAEITKLNTPMTDQFGHATFGNIIIDGS